MALSDFDEDDEKSLKELYYLARYLYQEYQKHERQFKNLLWDFKTPAVCTREEIGDVICKDFISCFIFNNFNFSWPSIDYYTSIPKMPI